MSRRRVFRLVRQDGMYWAEWLSAWTDKPRATRYSSEATAEKARAQRLLCNPADAIEVEPQSGTRRTASRARRTTWTVASYIPGVDADPREVGFNDSHLEYEGRDFADVSVWVTMTAPQLPSRVFFILKDGRPFGRTYPAAGGAAQH